MSLLLDTHALLWWLLDDPRLSRTADAAIRDGAVRVAVSAATAWEVSTKVRTGKLPEASHLAGDFAGACTREGFTLLPISVAHAAVAGALAIPHKDPFDRLLIAQAQLDGLLLVSNETMFDGFGVRRLW